MPQTPSKSRFPLNEKLVVTNPAAPNDLEKPTWDIKVTNFLSNRMPVIFNPNLCWNKSQTPAKTPSNAFQHACLSLCIDCYITHSGLGFKCLIQWYHQEPRGYQNNQLKHSSGLRSVFTRVVWKINEHKCEPWGNKNEPRGGGWRNRRGKVKIRDWEGMKMNLICDCL